MGFIERIKHAIVSNGEGIALRDLQAAVRAGEDLHGTLELVGGEHDVNLEGVLLRLDEERLIYDNPRHGDFDFWREAAAVTIPLGRSLAPGERLQVPVVLPLPADLEPSATHRRYRVTAKLQASGRHPKASALVAVVA
ncbi:sporulation protein [Nannocystis pusilla]|uniref:sporulation protein n=1 Tax=Nannocystis pusilla TaxID=889268 RepID=UPI003DA22234